MNPVPPKNPGLASNADSCLKWGGPSLLCVAPLTHPPTTPQGWHTPSSALQAMWWLGKGGGEAPCLRDWHVQLAAAPSACIHAAVPVAPAGASPYSQPHGTSAYQPAACASPGDRSQLSPNPPAAQQQLGMPACS